MGTLLVQRRDQTTRNLVISRTPPVFHHQTLGLADHEFTGGLVRFDKKW